MAKPNLPNESAEDTVSRILASLAQTWVWMTRGVGMKTLIWGVGMKT
jgi:hypothetical protein